MVVNTCAFIEAARQESIDTVLALADARRAGARLVVTGCMAERYGDELAEALPEVDLVAPFGASLPVVRRDPAHRGAGHASGEAAPAARCPSFDLLNLPRPPAAAPWSYVKVAEGCDRNCGFCAIPSFRGKQRSRSVESILAEVDQLGAVRRALAEVVLVAQDLSSFALDRSTGRVEPRIDGPAVGGSRPSSIWWRRWRNGSAGPGCSTSTRPPSTTPWSRPYWPPACPTSTSPSSTCPVRC